MDRKVIIMHDNIKAFRLEGFCNDAAIDKTKENLIQCVVGQMHDEGYIQVYDLDPHFTLQYDAGRKIFKFNLTVYGVPGDNKQWSGITAGKLIPRSTPRNKSPQH